jgi:hypothetical protein
MNLGGSAAASIATAKLVVPVRTSIANPAAICMPSNGIPLQSLFDGMGDLNLNGHTLIVVDEHGGLYPALSCLVVAELVRPLDSWRCCTWPLYGGR